MSPHAVDDDRRGRAQQQGGHDDNGGQDDEDNDPDIQDVLGEHDFHGDLADGVHAASPWDPRRAAFKTRGHRRSQKAPDLRKVPGTETAPSPQAPALAAGGGPQTGISPQNVPGSSEELAVAAGTRDWAPGTLSRWLWNARPPGTAPRPPPPGSAPPPASRGPRGREKPAGERKDPGVSDSPSSLVTHSRRGPGQALLPSRGSPLCVVNRGADLNCVFQEPSRLQSTQESLANGFRSGSWTGSLGFVILSAVASLTTGFPSLFHSL